MSGFLYDVCVPAYNSKATLPSTLDSIFSQEIRPHRVVVIDDGSTDGTSETAREIGVWTISTPNRGTAAARNVGLRALCCDYVAFVDADDMWLPTMSSAQAQLWGQLPASAALLSTGRTTFVGRPLPQQDEVNSDLVVSQVVPSELWLQNVLTASATMYRRAALEQVGGFRDGSRTVEDYDVALRLMAAEWTLFRTPKALCLWRFGASSKTAHVAEMLDEESRVLTSFYASVYRRLHLSDANLGARLRQSWRRAIARAAIYRLDFAILPPIAQYAPPTIMDRFIDFAIHRRLLGPLLAKIWRARRAVLGITF